MHDPLGLLIFIVILVISLLGKLRKKSEDAPSQPTSEIPDLNDIPDIVRRMFTGEAAVPKARPARPKEVDDDDEGWQPVPPVIIQAPQRRASTYQPPVARPAVRPISDTEGPSRPKPPIVVKAPVPGPPARQAPPRPAPKPVTPVQPLLTPTLTPTLTRSQTLSAKSLRAPIAPKCEAPANRQPQARGKQQRNAACGLVNDLVDVRRGIILSEVLGPPVSMR